MTRTALLLCMLLLSGCGTTYMVAVDSLSSVPPLAPFPASTCSLEPGMPGTVEQDLLFREVGNMLQPALAFHGINLTDDANAPCVIRLSYWQNAPELTLEETTVTVQKPVLLHDGKKSRVGYVHVQEPALRTRTTYSAGLMAEAYVKAANGSLGEQMWKTTVTCYGPQNDFRTLLHQMAPALPGALATQSQGLRRFEVYVEDGGATTVKELNSNSWW